jgi:hypothetical protein
MPLNLPPYYCFLCLQIWWIAEFSFTLGFLLGVKLGYVIVIPTEFDDPEVVRFTFMNAMGWGMALPILQFLYVVAFILQVGVSCILIKACKGVKVN